MTTTKHNPLNTKLTDHPKQSWCRGDQSQVVVEVTVVISCWGCHRILPITSLYHIMVVSAKSVDPISLPLSHKTKKEHEITPLAINSI